MCESDWLREELFFECNFIVELAYDNYSHTTIRIALSHNTENRMLLSFTSYHEAIRIPHYLVTGNQREAENVEDYDLRYFTGKSIL